MVSNGLLLEWSYAHTNHEMNFILRRLLSNKVLKKLVLICTFPHIHHTTSIIDFLPASLEIDESSSLSWEKDIFFIPEYLSMKICVHHSIRNSFRNHLMIISLIAVKTKAVWKYLQRGDSSWLNLGSIEIFH